MYIEQAISSWKKKETRYIYALFFIIVFVIIAGSGVFAIISATSSGNVYVDPKLGFSLQVPASWNAHEYPGTNNSTTTSSIIFSTPSSSQDQIGVSVMRNTDNARSFAERGKPTLYIGNHPAFGYDTPKQMQYPLACMIRVMLAGNDLITGSWCSPQAASVSRVHTFEGVLATYASQGVVKPDAAQAKTVNAVESCQTLIKTNKVTSKGGNWGKQQGNPTDAQWAANFNPGAAICDNFMTSKTSSTSYLFQCVELANRFVREQWGITPGFTVSASQYFDYYQNGIFHPGQARTLYGNNVQLSNDASQGTSSFAPVPGDLLVWQSVTNPSQGWTSGLDSSFGHVAIITNVDATHVSIAQQNYSATKYYNTLTLTKVANGWIIGNQIFRDVNTITRGWIHFYANPHAINFNSGGISSDDNASSTSVGTNTNGMLEVFAHGSDNNIYHIWQTGKSTWSRWTLLQVGKAFQGDPTVVSNADGRLEVFARGGDNNIYTMWQMAPGSGWNSGGWVPLQSNYSFQGTPAVAKDANGLLEVFARGSDNHIWRTSQLGTAWSGWSILQSSNSFLSNPEVGTDKSGLLEVFARGNDNNIWHIAQASTLVWSGWGVLQGGIQFQGTPSIAPNVDGRLEVFARDNNNTLRHAWQIVPGGPWSGWGTLAASAKIGGNPSASVNADGRLEIFVRGTDSNIYCIWQTAAGVSWYGGLAVVQSHQSFKGTPVAAHNADGSLEVLAIGSNNNIWATRQVVAGGAWSSWAALYPNYGFIY